MNDNVIFSIIWRIAGIVLLLLMLVALVAVGVSLFYYVNARRRAAFDTRVTLLAEREARFGFGEFQFIKGTRYLMSSYGPPYEFKGSLPGSYGGGAARNYLFIHADDQTLHYLFPTLAQVILNAEQLRVGDGTGRNTPVQWLYFHIVDADTNCDGLLTEEDGFSIAFANPDGTELQTVVRGVTAVLGRARLASGDILLLFYQSSDKSFVSQINIAERRVVTTKELPRLPLSGAATLDRPPAQ